MDQSMVDPGRWWNISIIATPSDIEFVGVCWVFCVLTQSQSQPQPDWVSLSVISGMQYARYVVVIENGDT